MRISASNEPCHSWDNGNRGLRKAIREVLSRGRASGATGVGPQRFGHCVPLRAGAANKRRARQPVQNRACVRTWTDPKAVTTWLDAELSTLTAVAVQAPTADRPAVAVQLSGILFRYLDETGRHTDALIIHRNARYAAAGLADTIGEARALHGLGASLWQQGDYDLATSHTHQALTLFREAGDQVGTARTLGNLGIIELRQGRYGPAIELNTRALALYQQAGDVRGQIPPLLGVGAAEGWLGRHDAAIEHLSQALALAYAHEASSVPYALATLGDVETARGRYERAVEHLQQALALFRQFGNRTGEAWSLDSLGTVHTRLGQYGAAARYHAEALALFRRIGDRDGEPWALNGLGEAVAGDEQPTEALSWHTAAVRAATALGNLHQQARAHAGLATAHRGLGAASQAEEYDSRALDLFTELGTPEAVQIRTRRER